MDEMEQVKREYAETLPQRAAAVQRSVAAVTHELGRRGTPPWNELMVLVHKLAGSSGTYGYSGLYRVSRYLEDRILDKSLLTLKPEYAAGHLQRWSNVFMDVMQRASQGTIVHEEDSTLVQALDELETHVRDLLGKKAA